MQRLGRLAVCTIKNRLSCDHRNPLIPGGHQGDQALERFGPMPLCKRSNFALNLRSAAWIAGLDFLKTAAGSPGCWRLVLSQGAAWPLNASASASE